MAVYNSGKMTSEEIKMLDGIIEKTPEYKKWEKGEKKKARAKKRADRKKIKTEKKNKKVARKTKVKSLKKELKKTRDKGERKNLKDKIKYTKDPEKFKAKTLKKDKKTYKKARKAESKVGVRKSAKSLMDEAMKKDAKWEESFLKKIRDIVRPNFEEDVAYGRSTYNTHRDVVIPGDDDLGSSDRDDARRGRIYREADESFVFQAPEGDFNPETGKKWKDWEIRKMKDEQFMAHRERAIREKYKGVKGKIRSIAEDAYDEYLPEKWEGKEEDITGAHIRRVARDHKGRKIGWGDNVYDMYDAANLKGYNIERDEARKRVFEENPISETERQILYDAEKPVYENLTKNKPNAKTFEERVAGSTDPYSYYGRLKKKVKK